MTHCPGCCCEVKGEGVSDPMGEYALELEAHNERLIAALNTCATFAEWGGENGRLEVIALRCRLCGSGAVPDEPIPHTDECPLSSANDPANYPHPETEGHSQGHGQPDPLALEPGTWRGVCPMKRGDRLDICPTHAECYHHDRCQQSLMEGHSK